jgi:hypothetical protein
MAVRTAALPWMQRRKLILKATFESRLSNYGFKRLLLGAFNTGSIG